ncbi:Hemerythrin HHE cation binding domain protein [Melioribacter roseus P3M-2]|uniref:Hemerythrin HHE cation binding domain protein n=1 Tax=Melioribacter roseus (strain DSM 23840 / JCM 17771 / VKM B-2668 / P3M-2) TaxID=1191523 RepID=I7A4Q8_MELRP|nr:hemerythrin domain-containing protein [Melioribacter roseus]AFN74871.1 Hemerythrin HHE cation binding domain protein [Melioribacter roseus P3M-2]
MKRHPSLVELSKEHHDGLILAQILKKDAPAYRDLPSDREGKRKYALQFYREDLVKHFYKEEKILLPFCSGISPELDKLFQRMLEEHKRLEKLFDKLKNESDYENAMHEIGKLLDDHIRMEERELFESVQKHLDEEKLSLLSQKLKG